MSAGTGMRVLYVGYEFPKLTETFVYRELAELRSRGIDARAVVYRIPDPVSAEARPLIEFTTAFGSPGVPVVLASLGRALVRSPLRVLSAARFLFRPVEPWTKWFSHLYHFLYSTYVLTHYPVEEFDIIHAHFAAGPGSIALFLATLAGKPFSITAHAYDLFLHRVALRDKILRAGAFVTISEYNRVWLAHHYNFPARLVHVIHCGIALDDFEYRDPEKSAVPSIVAIGSAVPQKGHDTLIRACGLLRDRGVPFTCTIVGGGELLEDQRRLIAELELESRVQMVGAQPQERVREILRNANVSVLACQPGPEPTMDGIPVALMESMAMGVPVVTTFVSGNPELVRDEIDGILVPCQDPPALARALARVADDLELRRRLAASGRRRIEEQFNLRQTALALAEQLRRAISA